MIQIIITIIRMIIMITIIIMMDNYSIANTQINQNRMVNNNNKGYLNYQLIKVLIIIIKMIAN
jgi:hypothetical protein